MVLRTFYVAVCLASVASGCSTWTTTGSVVRGPHTHLGIRPAAELDGAAVTLQLSTDALP
jgi:hypothetical protein